MTSTSSQPHLQGHRQGQRQQALLFPEEGGEQHEEEEQQTLAVAVAAARGWALAVERKHADASRPPRCSRSVRYTVC